MATTYTSLLGLALPTTGELSGEWGEIVNDYISTYIDAAVAGTQSISTDTTLTKSTGTALGSTSSQYMVLLCNPTLANITITAPAASKTYIVINTSATYTVTIRGVGPTTGIIIPASDRALVVWNGSDFVRVGSSAGGLNTQVQYNNSGNLAGSANLTFNGTTLTANTLNLTNALGAVYGGTGLTSVGAVGNVLISNGTTWVSSSLNTGAQAFVTQATGGNQPPGAFSPSDSFALI